MDIEIMVIVELAIAEQRANNNIQKSLKIVHYIQWYGKIKLLYIVTKWTRNIGFLGGENMEILGNKLKRFFDTVDNPLNDAEITYAGNRYEVWEVSEDLFNKMCDMSEEEFVELAGEEAWWRQSDGSVLGVPDTKFIISGEEMVGWNTRGEYENFQYAKLTDNLCYGIGASQPKNVSACAMDLAKYNDMTMAELFEKYGE